MSALAVGAYLRLLASIQDISLTELTSAAGVALKYITQIENGEIVQPTAGVLWKLTNKVNGNWDDIGRLMASTRPTATIGRLAAMQWALDRGLLTGEGADKLRSATPEELDAIAVHLVQRKNRRARP